MAIHMRLPAARAARRVGETRVLQERAGGIARLRGHEQASTLPERSTFRLARASRPGPQAGAGPAKAGASKVHPNPHASASRALRGGVVKLACGREGRAVKSRLGHYPRETHVDWRNEEMKRTLLDIALRRDDPKESSSIADPSTPAYHEGSGALRATVQFACTGVTPGSGVPC